MATPVRNRAIRDDVRSWLKPQNVDLAVGMHLPRLLQGEFRRLRIGDDQISFSQQLRHCFNRFDQRIYRGRHRRQNMRVSRLIFLEHQESVGWHAHILIRSPDDLGPIQTSAILNRLWHQRVRNYTTKDFGDKLYWSEPLLGNYFEYATKFLDRGAEVDWGNLVR